MEHIDSFGYYVRRRRKALDLTQDALAHRVGCSTITLKKIEADQRRPSLQLVELLAQARLAVVHLQQDDPGQARELIGEAMRTLGALHMKPEITALLAYLANLALVDDNMSRAQQLLAARDQLHRTLTQCELPLDMRAYEHTVAALQAALAREGAPAVRQPQAEMTLAAIVAWALESPLTE